MVQKFPQRFTVKRHAGLRPRALRFGGAKNRLLDLLGRWHRGGAVIDTNVNRAVAFGAQTRHDTGVQDRGLAQTGLTEQHGQELSLHATRKLANLVFTTVEILTCLLGERCQAQPRVLGGDGGGLCWRSGGAHARLSSWACSRSTNALAPSPLGSLVKCAALNLSGTWARTSTVSSIHTGSRNTAPSVMLRERSTA